MVINHLILVRQGARNVFGVKVMLHYDVDVSKLFALFMQQTYIRIDFSKDSIHLIQPKSSQFPAEYGTAEKRVLPIIICWSVHT